MAATKAQANRLELTALRIRQGLEVAATDGGIATLGVLVGQYEDELRRRGRSKHHTRQTARQLRDTIKGLGWDHLLPERADGTMAAKWVADRQRVEDWSNATYNLYAGALRSFGKWMARNRVTPSNPFESVPKRRAEETQTFERRALGEDELQTLLSLTPTFAPICGMSGQDRAMLYRLAAYTGLRVGELRSLTPESFEVADGRVVSVTVKAVHSKRRKTDTQPVPSSIGEAVAAWLKDKPAKKRVFGGWNDWHTRGAKMVRLDLEACGLEADTADGRLDAHALRATYITRLCLSGASLQSVQKLARHSTPTLTMARYAKINPHLKDDADRLQ